MFLNTEHHLPVKLQLVQNANKFLILVCYPAAYFFDILELEIWKFRFACLDTNHSIVQRRNFPSAPTTV